MLVSPLLASRRHRSSARRPGLSMSNVLRPSLVAYFVFLALTAIYCATPTVAADAGSRTGKDVYAAECSSCHGAHLDGGMFGPPIKGVKFTSKWAVRPEG